MNSDNKIMKPLTTILQSKRTAVLGILIIALLPRLLLLPKALAMGLGVDDLQSAIHAFLPMNQLFKSVQTFDPNPPLFYLQLHFWEKAGTGDLWLMMNPFLWSLLAVLSLMILGRKVLPFQAGAFASLLFALSPVSVTYSVIVRMYGLLILASIWVWYFTHQFFTSDKKWIAGVGIFISTLIFLYSQGAGFIILPSGIVYAALIAAKSWRKHWQSFAKYLLVQGIIILSYVPWLLRARTIHVAHPLVPGPADIAQTSSELLFGFYHTPSSYAHLIYIMGAISFSLILIILLLHKSSRNIVLSFGVVPLVVCFVISYLVEPIWLTRTLVQVSPFICLGMALILVDWIHDRRLIRTNSFKFIFEMSIIGVILIGAVIGLVDLQHNYYPWTPLKGSADLIKKNIEDVDIVYIPYERMYWGWSWYFFGPGHVTPLTTNYIMVQDGVTVVSRPSVATMFGEGHEEHRWWIIYRDTDDFGALSSYVKISDLKPVETFTNVIVSQVDIKAIPKP